MAGAKPCRAGLCGHGMAFSFYSKSNRKSLNSLHQRNGRMKFTLYNIHRGCWVGSGLESCKNIIGKIG